MYDLAREVHARLRVGSIFSKYLYMECNMHGLVYFSGISVKFLLFFPPCKSFHYTFTTNMNSYIQTRLLPGAVENLRGGQRRLRRSA